MSPIIPREPGVATSKGERQSGYDQHRATGGDEAGHGLAYDACDLAGVRETKYRTELAAASVGREWFPTDNLPGRAIQHELRSLLRLTTTAAIDVESKRSGGRRRKLQRDAAPVVHLLLGYGPRGVDVG